MNLPGLKDLNDHCYFSSGESNDSYCHPEFISGSDYVSVSNQTNILNPETSLPSVRQVQGDPETENEYY